MLITQSISVSPAHLSERRRSKTLFFHISNQRNRLRPQASSVNPPRANKEYRNDKNRITRWYAYRRIGNNGMYEP